MATTQHQLCVTLEAGQDLSAKQFYFVSMSSDGQIDPAGDGAKAVGVLQNDPAAAGRAAEVAIVGVTKMKCGGAITAGGNVSSDTNGAAVATATGDVPLGIALETGAPGRIISVLLMLNATA